MRVRLALVLPVLGAGLLLAGCGTAGGDDKPFSFGATPTVTTEPAKPTRTDPPLHPAAGSPVTVGEDAPGGGASTAQTIQCQDNDVSVVGTMQNLTFTGACRSISIESGVTNRLTVDQVATLRLSISTGNIINVKAVDTITLDADTIGNIIIADTDLAGTGRPRCDDTGTENDCPR